MFSPYSLPSTFAEYDEYLGWRFHRVVANNTVAVRYLDTSTGSMNNIIDITYHGHVIATLWRNGDVDVSLRGDATPAETGYYRWGNPRSYVGASRTTITRVNAILGRRGHIRTVRYVPHIKLWRSAIVPFASKNVISFRGNDVYIKDRVTGLTIESYTVHPNDVEAYV